MSDNNLVYYNHLLLFMSNSNLAYYNLIKSSVDRDKRKNKGKNIFFKKLKIVGMKCRDKPEKKNLAERKIHKNHEGSLVTMKSCHILFL